MARNAARLLPLRMRNIRSHWTCLLKSHFVHHHWIRPYNPFVTINKPTLDVPSIKYHVVPILMELYCVSFSCTLGSGRVFPFGHYLFYPFLRKEFILISLLHQWSASSFKASSSIQLPSSYYCSWFLLPFISVSVSSVRFQAASIGSVPVSLCVSSFGFRSVYYFPSPHITQLPPLLLLSPPPLYR